MRVEEEENILLGLIVARSCTVVVDLEGSSKNHYNDKYLSLNALRY
jgi:hypothetical protein